MKDGSFELRFTFHIILKHSKKIYENPKGFCWKRRKKIILKNSKKNFGFVSRFFDVLVEALSGWR